MFQKLKIWGLIMQTQLYSSEELKNRYKVETKLSDIISDFEKECWDLGQVICEVHLNGSYIAENEEGMLSSKTVADVMSLEILTRNQNELIEVTLRTVNQWLPKLRVRSVELSEAFKGDVDSIDTNTFIELIDGCKWLSDSLCLLKPNLDLIVDEEAFVKAWAEVEMVFTSVAKEILQAFENKDYVLLSDILEHDMPSALDQWQALVFDQPAIRIVAKV